MALKGIQGRPPTTINIVDHNNFKDRIGLLGKGVLVPNTITQCLTVSKYTGYLNMYINVTNDDTSSANIRLWVTDKNVPALEDLIEAKIYIEAGLTYVRGPIILSANEKVFLSSTSGSCVYRLYGADLRNFGNP